MSSVPASAPARGGLAVLIALTLVYVVWGSTYLAIRFALEGGFPPLLMAGMRFLVAGALMYAVLRLRGLAAPTRRRGSLGSGGSSPVTNSQAPSTAFFVTAAATTATAVE